MRRTCGNARARRDVDELVACGLQLLEGVAARSAGARDMSHVRNALLHGVFVCESSALAQTASTNRLRGQQTPKRSPAHSRG